MQKKLTTLCLALLTMSGGEAMAQPLAKGKTEFAEGVVRVKLQREVASLVEAAKLPTDGKLKAGARYVKTGVKQLDVTASKLGAVSMKRVFPYAGKDEEKHKAFGLDLWYDITYNNEAMTPAQARNLYRSTLGVQYAQRIPVYSIPDDQNYLPVSPSTIARAQRAASTMPFNDPLLPDQWHYYNDGHIYGTKAGADINLFPAWESGVTGSKDVIVAIIDGGFQIDHPDLKDNLWINEAELNGKPGVDDDGDGFVDDIYGYNFVINSANINAHTHGTHVAGTVGATNNNGIGVGGVAGGSDGTGGVKMMVCQVFDSRASSSAVADFGAALVYAADRGASIAQCSWGMGMAGDEDVAVSEAVRYFTANGGGEKMNGGLCIFAAGNNGEEGDFYPGCLDEAVAVGALASDGSVAYYSNRGAWVDVTAPGGLMDSGQQYGVLSTLPGSTYGYNEGTSMACPHVSGIAALILSKYGNKQFSNETLRTLLTTSVNDMYTQNPDYVGLMGSGYIDAYKALQGKEGSTPDAVADFTVTPSHDNALIEWTIPESEEKSIDHHVIYYSTEEFSASDNLNSLPSVSVDTKFKYSGDKMAYELNGLKATTKYYFAIVAYNRWGKASAVSPIKSATTNAGPKVELDKTSLSMAVDASKSLVGETSFNVKNAGEGVLKYELEAATKRVSISTSARNEKPQPGQMVKFSGTVSPMLAKANTIASSDYYAADWPDTLTYSKALYSYIGESDLKLPNAMAQYFYVDKRKYPNGFNLTGLRFQGHNGTNPEIAIYDGARSISTASLIQTVPYDFWAYNWKLNLQEQIYFAPGSSFWVVAKFPAGAKNPLGAGKSNRSDIAQYSFYSSDNGNTWTQLSEVLKGSSFEAVADQLTWAVQCISQNPDWSAVLSPEPISGEVRPGESQTVTMRNDGQKLVNGTYNFNLHLKTNEATDSKSQVALTMTVKGNKPELHSQQLVDFGSLLVGQEKTISVELTNSGYGVFGGKWGYIQASSGDVTSSSDQFDVSKGMMNVAARASGLLPVTFKPTKEGNVSSTITLKDKSGQTYSFIVRGVASMPAKMEIAKNEYDLGNLKVGGSEKTAVVTIKNTGNYPLQYVFPKYSSKKIDGSKQRVHKFGYTIKSNVAGDNSFSYEPVPELSDPIDLTSQFTTNNWQSSAVKLGFKFPFYGKEYEEVYVSSYGGLSMLPMEGRISCMVPTGDCVDGLGYVSAYTNSGWMDMGANSKVTCGRKDGKFYVIFKDVVTPATNGAGEVTTLSFHMALCPDGSVEVYYDDYTPAGVFGSGGNNFVGVSDIAAKDACVFTDAAMVHSQNSGVDAPYYDIQTGSAIKIVAPSKSMIKSLSSTDGYIGNGESQDITVTLAAGDDLYAGELTNYLTVVTNDPLTPSANIALKANITGTNLKAEAGVDATEVDFGKVFRTSQQKRTVVLSNNGKNVLKVRKVAVKSGKFTVADDIKSGFNVPAGQSKDIAVTLPTQNKGNVSDVLVISYWDGKTTSVNLKGEVIGAPVWNITPETVESTTPYGVNVTRDDIAIANNGDETLTFAPQPETWYRPMDLIEEDGKSSVDYIFRAKSDGFDVPFEWIDIVDDYTEHMPYSYYIEKTDFKKVELPFEFPFYGKKYKEMYIYNTGFVSFDAPVEDYKQFPEPPASLPTTETFYSNIICPFWGNHSMNTPSSDGVYYKANDDNCVVTFKNYGNTMMSGMNFQLIMRKDGTFKFQYLVSPEGFQLGVFGLCGIMDHSETRGINPSDMYINSGNAVEFMPYKNYSVAPGESVSMPVTLLADQLADTYEYALNIKTNDPQNENVSVPVTMNITGEADAEFPETLVIEQPVDAAAMSQPYYEFSVVNKGTRAFTVTDVNSDMFMADESDPYAMPEAKLEVYIPNENGGGADPGPLAASDVQKVWMPYDSGMMEPLVVGKEPLKFRIGLYNVSKVHQKDYTMTFNVEGLDVDTKTTNVKLNITEAPVLAFDKKEIRISNVSDDYVGEVSANMKNNGGYKLTYDLQLSPSGRDAVVEYNDFDEELPFSAYNVIAKPSLAEVKTYLENGCQPINGKKARKAMGMNKVVKDDQKFFYDVPTDFEYPVLYHPVLNPVTSAIAALMGSGDKALDENFYAATRYEAPAEGFNVTDLYFVGTVGTLENVDIEASIILGNDVTATERTVGHGKLHVDSEEPGEMGYQGKPYMLTFDKPVYINPTDTFYVVMKYPAGYKSSALMASKDGDMEPGRYMAHLKALGGWVDIEEIYDGVQSTGAFGYFMTCVQRTEGEPWIKLLNENTAGEVEAKGTLPLKFSVNAKSAYFTRNNKATLVVRTNDPANKTYNYHIFMDKNGAPVVEATEAVVAAKQGITTNVPVTVNDLDGDAFTVSVDDQSGFATVAEYCNENGTQEGITLADGTLNVAAGKTLKMTVGINPEYGKENVGPHKFEINATDANGNAGTTTVDYSVVFTNRAPEFIGEKDMTVGKGTVSQVVYYNTLFNDPDGDEMTYKVTTADESIAQVYGSANGFVVSGNRLGYTKLNIVATDSENSSTTQTISLAVVNATGIDAVTLGDGMIAAVADGDVVYVKLGMDAADAKITILTNGGMLVGEADASNVKAGSVTTVKLASAAAPGVYIASVVADGKQYDVKFVVK